MSSTLLTVILLSNVFYLTTAQVSLLYITFQDSNCTINPEIQMIETTPEGSPCKVLGDYSLKVSWLSEEQIQACYYSATSYECLDDTKESCATFITGACTPTSSLLSGPYAAWKKMAWFSEDY